MYGRNKSPLHLIKTKMTVHWSTIWASEKKIQKGSPNILEHWNWRNSCGSILLLNLISGPYCLPATSLPPALSLFLSLILFPSVFSQCLTLTGYTSPVHLTSNSSIHNQFNKATGSESPYFWTSQPQGIKSIWFILSQVPTPVQWTMAGRRKGDRFREGRGATTLKRGLKRSDKRKGLPASVWASPWSSSITGGKERARTKMFQFWHSVLCFPIWPRILLPEILSLVRESVHTKSCVQMLLVIFFIKPKLKQP